MSESLQINGVEIEATFAEAFDMKATRIIITADDQQWADEAAAAMTGFGTSVIACKIEIDVERRLQPNQTPDGRPGVAILAFAVSGSELEKQIPVRAGQCVLTCPTTALFAGIDGDAATLPKRIPLGKTLRYFGDGHQISKIIGGQRFWRVPVMDGEFLCAHDVGRVDGIGGGNFLLMADSMRAATSACRAAVAAIKDLPGVITPFPGGATRSGSKVGSKYKTLMASTNEAYSPALLGWPPKANSTGDSASDQSALSDDIRAVLEVVIDGMSFDLIADAMRVGIHAACDAGGGNGLLRVTAGNYGGKLGRHHFKLAEILK
ncbi:formylmethanofuran--tetrahydromethanopterin N-formyltransferase [Stieleria varia]|uniref:Formylmethanofuran--tetrahydromethanopterin formyltransferase n=2 Tax=Stieleria varia TaxID=2528005 RepID=A0A5C6B8D1_9BACT|nr:formylmethanofuran--tetrahydromethanopterin N-formyltransferase [Stieleria varia]TWU08525.1 Formyltransferase/hydrolase complex subunit D [Stieleria varia]